ncbi:hypothetical protein METBISCDRAFT_29468 [Metschnikowia bicuspidata]|uniref:Dipeptidyl aminopeptidase B n=1 Tax=Metschnikowia bicuspidata TaxID=27322 RepID=A0A4P9ZKA5_9ASCO|nr:hypothetical protein METBISCDRAFT_29468 [Metschnikowia bicuspidata]
MAIVDLEKWATSDRRVFTRSTLYGLSLIVLLVWGSAFFATLIALSLGSRPQRVSPAQAKLKPLTIDNWMSGTFRPTFQRVQWIQSPESANYDRGTYLVKESAKNNKDVYLVKSILHDDYVYTLFNGSSFKYHGVKYTINDLTASPDLTRAVITTNWVHSWRHSSTAFYWILDVETQSITPLYNTHDKLSFASWSPTSSLIAFVFEYNVYVKDLNAGTIAQITDDGSANVFNAKPDWVYEEEVFASDRVLWWSPDGAKLTFLKLNDASVPDFTIPFYVQDSYEEYPEMVSLKYPKPGYANPMVDLVVVQLPKTFGSAFQMHKAIFPSAKITEKLITEVLWVSNEKILVKTTNRASDIMEIFLVSADATDNAVLVRSHTAANAWFEVSSNAIFVPKDSSLGRYADGYIDVVQDEGYNHLAYFLPPENPKPLMLTRGQWEVLSNYVDLQKNLVYFTATKDSSVERHFYSVNLLDVFHQKDLPKITAMTNGSNWYSGSFSSGSRFLLLTSLGPDVPLQRLVDLHSNKVVKVLETNNDVRQVLETYDLPTTNVSAVTLDTEDNGGKSVQANVVEILPPSFDPSKKYPVLFYVYGGPGSQLVTRTYAIDFSHVVAAQLNAVVVTVDGRGTGYNNINSDLGAKFKFCVRDKLGHFEPLDQIAAAREWIRRPYVDSSRVAIWGWSYGGFLTLKTLEQDKNHVFSYGVSVAPVTQWKLYDSIYTERYLRTPQDNPEGYKTASITNAESFKDVKRFLMMHGSGDDNVHFQNSLRLIDEFNLHSVENFDFMVFPDSDHSISYHNGHKIVYDRILDWVRRAFSNEFLQVAHIDA